MSKKSLQVLFISGLDAQHVNVCANDAKGIKARSSQDVRRTTEGHSKEQRECRLPKGRTTSSYLNGRELFHGGGGIFEAFRELM